MYLTEPPSRDKLVLMPAAVNVEAKNLLAKLLASENIWIHHRKVDTAYFDMVNRILTFPMWKEMSDVVYTLLAGHETSHALNTYDIAPGKNGKPQRINLPASEYGKRIDPKNIDLACSYWNIIEDARIERLIKVPYPGLKGIFAKGYEELVNNNIFEIKGRDINKLPLIDRINIHFKAGHLVTLHFTPQEESLVRKVATTITMDDVVAVTKEIYNWSKQNETQPPPPITIQMTMEQFNEFMEEMEQTPQNSGQRGQKVTIEITDAPGEPDEDGDDESDEGDEGDESESSGKGKTKGKPKKGKKSSGGGDSEDAEDGDEDDAEDGAGSGKDDKKDDKGGKGKGKAGKDKGGDKKDADKDKKDSGDQDGDGGEDEGKADGGEAGDKPGKQAGKDGKKEKDGDKEGKGKKASTGHHLTKPVDPGPPPPPATQRKFDENIRKMMHDPNAQEIVYVTLPKPNLKNIVVEFETVHKNIRSHFSKTNIEMAEKDFAAFRDAQMPKINYILQQFEMRKQADRYKRTRQHKTGALDTLRLHSYKTEEDLFKTIAVCTDGKNHGLIFVVDWSGSMSSSMAGTLEQLIILCIFCRKAGIPFEVYSLTTGGRNAFTSDPGNLVYADNFQMRMYLSSRMAPGVFHDACVNLFAMMPNGTFSGGPRADNLIGCTPLDESIITTIDLVKEFRRKTNAQIVNAIFLTDGGANTVSEYINESGHRCGMGYGGYSYGYRQGNGNTKYLIDDRETHKVYSFTVGDMTPTMVKILRDRNNIHAVCFYIDGAWQNFFTTTQDSTKVAKQFEEDGFVVSTEWGFDEMYITKRGDVWRVKDQKLKPTKIEPGTPEFMKKAQENFVKQGQNMMKQRIMLDRFVKMIA